MNAYYEKNNRSVAIDNAKPLNIDVNFGDKLIAAICAIVAVFTSAVAVKIEKAVLCTGGFVAFFGVIGSIESGNLSMVIGVAVCAIISLAEFFIFKSMFKKKKAAN